MILLSGSWKHPREILQSKPKVCALKIMDMPWWVVQLSPFDAPSWPEHHVLLSPVWHLRNIVPLRGLWFYSSVQCPMDQHASVSSSAVCLNLNFFKEGQWRLPSSHVTLPMVICVVIHPLTFPRPPFSLHEIWLNRRSVFNRQFPVHEHNVFMCLSTQALEGNPIWCWLQCNYLAIQLPLLRYWFSLRVNAGTL